MRANSVRVHRQKLSQRDNIYNALSVLCIWIKYRFCSKITHQLPPHEAVGQGCPTFPESGPILKQTLIAEVAYNACLNRA